MTDPQRRPEPHLAPWRHRLHEIIFEADTAAGKAFDVGLLIAILASILAVSLETVEPIDAKYHRRLAAAEWVFTILFTIEYILRLLCVRRPARYAISFFGVIDLLAFLPTYLMAFLPGAQTVMVVRAFRLLRVFRVFKLGRMLSEASLLRRSLWAARGKIIVFLCTVLVVVAIMGTAMYSVENSVNGDEFSSIPQSMYWAVVTMTTVGYGDIAPQTILGQCIASFVMILGYGIIAVPTGIVTAELTRPFRERVTTRACRHCSAEGHAPDAKFCKYCGEPLDDTTA